MSDLELPQGSVIGGMYTVVDTLGVGGSGTVYRAHQAGMTRQVAVKLMHASHEEGESEKLRFAREAEVVKKLQHPHVVGLIDYGHHEDGTPYLVQPLLEGETLEQKLERERALGWEVTGRLAIHVLKALERAHSMDIAHRDIKPANIFVSNSPLGEIAQVLDFGLAKVVRGDLDNQMQVTRVGAVLGTPRYMAPEQARGEQVGQSADIYSFGLVMAEMLLGSPLIDGASDVEIYAMQGSDRPLRLPPAIFRSPFASVIQRAVAKPLDVRYRLASQMLADVNALASRLGGVAVSQPAEADMDATRMIDPASAIALSTPNETSEKLRTAFNVIEKKRAAAEAAEAAEALRPAPPDEPTGALPTGQPPQGPLPPLTAKVEVSGAHATVDPRLADGLVPTLESEPLVDQLAATQVAGQSPLRAAPMHAAPMQAPAVHPQQAPFGPTGAGHHGAPLDPTMDMIPPKPKSGRGMVVALVFVLLLLIAAIAALVYLLTLGK